MSDLHEFEQHNRIQFRNQDLLAQALTHRSYINEQADEALEDNERLEFLGDAILDFIAADMLYKRFPDMSEGELTRLRSGLVRTEALAELARTCRIGEFLRIGKGEEKSGGRTRTNNLCRAFEAVIGALYQDQGLQAVTAFVAPKLTQLQQQVMTVALDKDHRSQLQEWSQAELNITPIYELRDATGPDHDKEFHITVRIGSQIIAEGVGRSKQAAAQAAAKAALERIRSGDVNLST